MFESKFLRRIEQYPSLDLARRRDLYFYQLEASLEPLEWHNLTYPQGAQATITFNSVHSAWVDKYKAHITSVDPTLLFKSLALPAGCVNKLIYQLCLINRIRYELNYPLISAKEEEWIMWTIYIHDPTMLNQLDNLVLGKFENG